MKVLILYHSGSGSTRTVCELIAEKLNSSCDMEICEISVTYDYSSLQNYDFLVFAFPTYHCMPSPSSLEFISRMPKFSERLRVYCIATCGLYMGNTLRIAISQFEKKNIFTTGFLRVRGPGSDHLLYRAPKWLSFVFNYERNIKQKLRNAAESILQEAESENYDIKKPLPQWYVPLNNIFRYFGDMNYHRHKRKIHIEKGKCTNCTYCVKGCIRSCFAPGEVTPEFDHSNCEFCLKCIHNCPAGAILFSEKMEDRTRFNRKFYRELKNKIHEDTDSIDMLKKI